MVLEIDKILPILGINPTKTPAIKLSNKICLNFIKYFNVILQKK